jgi:phospholipid/cholesterol/gamma-HCH transport system substrate-binding protein
MAKKTIQDIKVGLFIFIAIALAFIVVFSIGSEKQLFESQYTLYTNFKDVGGLREGAPVRLAGVDVGTVSRVWFLDDLEEKLVGAELKINKSVKERIRSDSTASIQTMGLLGDKFIFITMGDPTERILKDGDFIPSSETVSLYGYIERADTIVGNIESITDSLDKFLSPLKEEGTGEDVAKIIKTTDELVTEVKDGQGTLHSLIYGGEEDEGSVSDLDDSLARLNSILTKIDEGEGTLGALINDPTLYEDLKIIMGGAKRSKTIKAVVNHSIKKQKKEEPEEETEK